MGCISVVASCRAWAIFDRSTFRNRFEAKGRFSTYLAAIPTWVITAANPALRGVGGPGEKPSNR
ncbi:MAG: glucokinase [Candidatus Competibacteraceae bacterium]